MSVENLNHCSKLTYPVVKHTETNIEFDDNLCKCELANWTTVTKETFILPKVENKKIGKRRELLMNYFRIQAAKDALEEIIGDNPLPESICSSEYIDNYCDSDFKPLMDNAEFDDKKLKKNPLYGGDAQSYYKEQFDKGNIKATAEFRNKKRPFVRRSLFTTPPELTLEEPINGF